MIVAPPSLLVGGRRIDPPRHLAAQTSRWAAANDSLAQAFTRSARVGQHQLLPWVDPADAPRRRFSRDGAGRHPEHQGAVDRRDEGREDHAHDCVLHDTKVHFFGDNLAVVYGTESSVRAEAQGKPEKRCLGWTDTCSDAKGRWQIIAAQDNVIAATAKR